MHPNRSLAIVFAFLALTAQADNALAQSPSVESRWDAFQADPVKAMKQLPPKANRKAATNFSATDVRTGAFIQKKNEVRGGSAGSAICDEKGVCLKDILSGRALAKEKPRDFFDAQDFKGKKPVFKLDEMEAAGLLKATLDETPWSDTYWPLYQGVLGARYANHSFQGGATWKGYYEFISNNKETLKEIARDGNELALLSLSPSEKYDLLIGDVAGDQKMYESGYLTPHMWAEGRAYWDQYGDVEPWMGICHGWAAASYMVPRPTKAVDVPSADGKLALKFYPSDMKGLMSYLWAKTSPPTRFIGGRCNDKDAKTDPESGRILDEKCFDTNPANWHQIVVNQIGVAKRSFVMDATFDYEVWNQPIHSYSYKYFNPQTGKTARKLSTATVEMSKFTNDKFKKFRAPKAAYVVGIEMEVTYVVEANASHLETDSAANDITQSVSYMYDLELDEKMNVIGGEWYSNAHPDFLWNPVYGHRAESLGDSQVTGTWDASKPLPKFWRDLAVATAARQGVPMAAVLEALLEKSNATTRAKR